MAGIVGIAAADREKVVSKALGKIAHRGGTEAGVKSCVGATLGHAWPRVQAPYAIAPGAAPPIVLDGEIHNWRELAPGASCVLEALDSAYAAQGPGFVEAIDGPFALAMAVPDGLVLARDRLGKAPLYCGTHKGALCFASEIKALLGWADQIEEFLPGHWYAPAQGAVQYASVTAQSPITAPCDVVVTELREVLGQSVRKRLCDGQVGAWLSGGLDSAAMTALARRDTPRLHTFSAGLEGAPDLQYARIVADSLDTEHHERIVTLDEMIALLPKVIYHLESFDALLVRSSVMNFLVGELAAGYVPAVLSGEGGDELFAGYSYLKYLQGDALAAELVDITRRLHNTALQRVDRCSSGHGIVARTGFLDRDVVDYALRIPADMKIKENGRSVEKWILRLAMDGLLPHEVVSRPKSKFWEGAGVGDLLSDYAGRRISDRDFTAQRRLADGSTLNTKEELFYYRMFREHFGDRIDPSLVGRTKGAPVT